MASRRPRELILWARFTIVSEAGSSEYLFFEAGDIITGVKQTLMLNWLKGNLEGKEGLVFITEVKPLT